jgi:hypothetical protein
VWFYLCSRGPRAGNFFGFGQGLGVSRGLEGLHDAAATTKEGAVRLWWRFTEGQASAILAFVPSTPAGLSIAYGGLIPGIFEAERGVHVEEQPSARSDTPRKAALRHHLAGR